MVKPTSFCYQACLLLIAVLLVNPLATALHEPAKGPTEWRGYKFKKQDIKELEMEFKEKNKIFDPKKIYKDEPNPTKL